MKQRGGKRPNAGRLSGWKFPKGTPRKAIKLPTPLINAIRAAKKRMSGPEFIQKIER